MTGPRVLALDFDGVVCDGRREYFEAARRAYEAAWPGRRAATPPDIEAKFSSLRPVIESGWEMPVLYHALSAGVPERELADRATWLATARRLLGEAGLDATAVGQALNAVRDEWFARDPHGWLAHHVFYPGVCERIEDLTGGPTRVVIVTTKAERFVQALLAAQRPALAGVPVIGRDPARVVPKPETLRRLGVEHALPRGGAGLWFVEDFLETLEAAHREPALGAVRFFLAAWGYNTLEQRAAVSVRPFVTLLSLGDFANAWSGWR